MDTHESDQTQTNQAAVTADPPDAMDQFTLWRSDHCEEALPVATIYEEQSFGQFIALVDETGAAIELDDVRRTQPRSNTRVSKTLSELAGGEKPAELPELASYRYPVSNLNHLLATKCLEVDGKQLKVELQPRSIERLLAGQEAEARVDDKIAWLQPLASMSTRPAVTEFRISSIADFLADPKLPGRGGFQYPLTLSAGQIERMRNGEGVELETESGVSVRLLALQSSNPIDELLNQSNDSERVSIRVMGPSQRIPPHAAARPVIGVYLPWRQRWILDGYARGRLLYSMSLAPQEETTIELFSWDRIRRSLDQTSQTDVEQNMELADTTKDVTDCMRELTRSSDFQVQADAKVSATYTSITAAVGAGMNIGLKSNEVARATTNTLHESTLKAVSRVKVQRTSKISETREVGSENRVTRKVRNMNLCHTLTFDYFEVISGYTITTEFLRHQAVLVALFPNPLGNLTFTRDNIRLYERSLRIALTDPGLASGFEAARLIASREMALKAVCDKPACAPTDSPVTDSDTEPSAPADPLVEAVRTAMKRLAQAWQALKSADWNGFFLDLDNRPDGTNPTAVHLEGIRRWFCKTMIDLYQYSISSALDDLAPELLDGDKNSLASLGTAFRTAIGDQGLAATLAQLRGQKTQIEELRMELIPRYSWGAENGWWDDKMRKLGCYDLDDAGLSNAWRAFDEAWKLWTAGGPLGGSSSPSEAGKEDQALDQVSFAYPLRDVADAMERLDTLLTHLNEAASYYRYAVFIGLPVAEQLERLQLGAAPGLVQPTVVGMVGSYVALAINTAAVPGLQQWFDDRMNDPALPTDGLQLSRRVTLPTGGISITTRLGDCCGCEEELEQNRRLDLLLKEQQLRSQTLEGNRRELRLGSNPPNLDSPEPTPNAWVVTLKASED